MICEKLFARSSSLPMLTELLKQFLETAVKNEDKSRTHFRYSDVIRYFSTYIYMISGRNTYEILSNNLHMPKAQTVCEFSCVDIFVKFSTFLIICSINFPVKYIGEHKTRIIEGSLRCEELLAYLENVNAPKTVWIAEDATGIIQKIVYDVATNQLVGIVLPMNGEGMPINFSFMAQSLDDIEHFMKKPMSTVAYLVMAQPIKRNTPPFLLQIFGSDNKFKTADVINRWKYTTSELKRYTLYWTGFQSDFKCSYF